MLAGSQRVACPRDRFSSLPFFKDAFLLRSDSSGIWPEVPDGNHVQARTTFDTTFDAYDVKVLPGPATPCKISSP
jgi:hypothetical protein